jgi:F-type H+-transporting ATPase subunit a
MDLHISLAAEELFSIGPITVTNSMFMMFVVMALILIVFTAIARAAQSVPGRAQSVIEFIVEFVSGLAEATAGKRLGRKILPLVAGLFIFILFSNLTGVLPGVGTIGVYKESDHGEEVEAEHSDDHAVVADSEHAEEDSDHAAADDGHGDKTLIPIMRPPTADLNMNIAMSLLVFVMVQVLGVMAHGIGGRLKHMADPPFIFPIEVLSELSRIISLAARLFGVVFAGEVLLGVMYAIGEAIKVSGISFLFPIPFLGLELLFGFIQALVFCLLTIVYIALAAAGHEDHEHEADHSGSHAGAPAVSH